MVGRVATARAALERATGELAAIAFSDIGDYFDAVGRVLPLEEIAPVARKALKTYSVKRHTLRDGSECKRFVVRLHDKGRALAMLARGLGMGR